MYLSESASFGKDSGFLLQNKQVVLDSKSAKASFTLGTEHEDRVAVPVISVRVQLKAINLRRKAHSSPSMTSNRALQVKERFITSTGLVCAMMSVRISAGNDSIGLSFTTCVYKTSVGKLFTELLSDVSPRVSGWTPT